MITKDKFNHWNIIKQDLHFSDNEEKYPKPWEIWYVNIWVNIWNESLWKWDFFKRPVLIIKKVWNLFFVVSMTTKWKENNKFYFKIDEKYFNKKSYLVLSQVKTIDKKRFIVKIWKISNKDFYEIKKELQEFLF